MEHGPTCYDAIKPTMCIASGEYVYVCDRIDGECHAYLGPTTAPLKGFFFLSPLSFYRGKNDAIRLRKDCLQLTKNVNGIITIIMAMLQAFPMLY